MSPQSPSCHSSADTLQAGEGAEVSDLPRLFWAWGAQLGCVGETHQYNSQESSSLAWGLQGSGKPVAAAGKPT